MDTRTSPSVSAADAPTVAEVSAFTARLRDLSGRMGRWEQIPQEELDAFYADRDCLVGRIGEAGR